MSTLSHPLDLVQARQRNPRPLLVDASLPPARIELSGRVLANWWAKDLGLLESEFSLGPGDTVELRLAASWRSIPLALAALTLGATVSEAAVTPGDVDLVIADDLTPDVLDAPEVLAVATAPLALDFGSPVPAGVVDHAEQVRAYPDQPLFDPAAAASARFSPAPGEPPLADLAALADAVAQAADAARAGAVAQADSAAQAGPAVGQSAPVIAVSARRGVLAALVQVLACGEDGHVVLHPGDTPDAALAAQEGVTTRA